MTIKLSYSCSIFYYFSSEPLSSKTVKLISRELCIPWSRASVSFVSVVFSSYKLVLVLLSLLHLVAVLILDSRKKKSVSPLILG